MRFCLHCRTEIPPAVLIRARWKAVFCSEACKNADRAFIREARREYRLGKGACPACGRRANARVQRVSLGPA